MSTLVYEDFVKENRADFVAKVRKISLWLGIDPNWLMAIMYFETARTMSPSITNSIGATGLIQFMPTTAIDMGTTTAKLRAMSNVEQLDWVYKYLKTYASKYKKFIDVYFGVFFPAAIGKPNDYVLETKKLSRSEIARKNPAFDNNKDGKITKGEVEATMLKKFPTTVSVLTASGSSENVQLDLKKKA